jgi:protein-disulfide isomerase
MSANKDLKAAFDANKAAFDDAKKAAAEAIKPYYDARKAYIDACMAHQSYPTEVTEETKLAAKEAMDLADAISQSLCDHARRLNELLSMV